MNARKALVCESLGAASGEIPRPPLNLALVKGCDILGVEWAKFAARQPEAHRANMSRVTDWAAAAKLATHIRAIHELADFQAAFAEIGERRAQGKAPLRLHGLFMRSE